jgi:DNA helicase-2/ATP-dependent DNA helicase PcrA
MIPALDPRRDGYPAGPPELVLVGPPGTGKTRVVLDAWLQPAVMDGAPGEVLGCSFTRAAAREMRSRLAKETQLPFAELWLTCRTIHSECLRLARLQQEKTAIFDERAPAGEDGQQQKQEQDDEGGAGGWEGLGEASRDRRKEAIRLWHLARHRHPAEALDEAPVPRLLALAGGSSGEFGLGELVAEVEAYEEAKAAAGQPDFTDLLLLALAGLPQARRLIVVDEAQDLSPLQIAVVRRWACASERLIWAGDPDQGIFGFAGADGRHLTELIRAGMPARSLQRSWRVPAAPHLLARELILRNADRVDAPYWPAQERAGQVMHLVADPARVVELLRQTATRGKTAFVLTRAGRTLQPYAELLEEQGVPFSRERGGSSPLRRRKLAGIVVALHCLLRWRDMPSDGAKALVDAIPGRPKGRYFAGTKKASVEAVEAAAEGQEQLGRTQLDEAGVRVAELLADRQLEPALERLGLLEEARGLLKVLAKHGDEPQVLLQRPPITLTTVHGSKGREADLVVVDLEAPAPTLEEIRTPAGAEGERRVLYVAITRTRGDLVLVHPPRYLSQLDLGLLLGLRDGEPAPPPRRIEPGWAAGSWGSTAPRQASLGWGRP